MRVAVTLLVFALSVAGCAGHARVARSPSHETTSNSIYVVRHGWHAGIVVRAANVPPNAWPARMDFPDADFLEVGWGDREYYQAKDPDVWLGLKAVFSARRGVLHFVALNGPVEAYFKESEIIQLGISEHGLDRLIAYVRDSHEIDSDGRPMAFGPGLYGESRFYASREEFHLFKTCNVWTANVLREAGVPVLPARSITAKALVSQLRPLGRMIR